MKSSEGCDSFRFHTYVHLKKKPYIVPCFTPTLSKLQNMEQRLYSLQKRSELYLEQS
jgi:hypothetical protein